MFVIGFVFEFGSDIQKDIFKVCGCACYDFSLWKTCAVFALTRMVVDSVWMSYSVAVSLLFFGSVCAQNFGGKVKVRALPVSRHASVAEF